LTELLDLSCKLQKYKTIYNCKTVGAGNLEDDSSEEENQILNSFATIQ